ncbi:MAG: response regulator transcription factor [Psychroserpens sp.]|uniref:response regulator n=1 Tax=Psychroserpens sp. TaxID=2020870 RepID=UPI003C77A1C5
MITKIAITDDHEMIRNGIDSLLENHPDILIIGKYSNALETISALKQSQPDVLLLDINLPDINGIDLCKALLKEYKDLKIIALSNFDETSFVKRILKHGASGYLLKNTSTEELISAIETVLKGEQYLQKDIQEKLMNRSIGQQKKNTLHIKLTRREKEVLQCIYEELTTQQTADQLFISPKTVETHRMNLMSKLGAKNSVGIIKAALSRALLDA